MVSSKPSWLSGGGSGDASTMTTFESGATSVGAGVAGTTAWTNAAPRDGVAQGTAGGSGWGGRAACSLIIFKSFLAFR